MKNIFVILDTFITLKAYNLVLEHCVFILFWSSGIMDCMGFLQLEKEFRLCAVGVSGAASSSTSDEQLQ